jgi:hypothetical protein
MTGKIILSVGMPRAGSGWHYNLVHDLAMASGGQNARQIRTRYRLERLLTEVNCNIGTLTFYRLLPVLMPALLGNTYVIKLHAGPKPLARLLIRLGLIRPTYIYRDPRDALLSSCEYGRDQRSSGRGGAFAQLTTIEAAIDFMAEYVRISDAWLACQSALHVRYEDLLLNYDAEATRLIDFLGIEMKTAQAVLDKYRPERGRQGQAGTHFVKGKIGRFREALTDEQQARCLETFGDYLRRMDYPI